MGNEGNLMGSFGHGWMSPWRWRGCVAATWGRGGDPVVGGDVAAT